MLVRELLALFDGLERIVDVTPGRLDLRRHLALPDGLHHDRHELGDVAGAGFGPDTLLLAVVGPDPADHTEPDELADVLASLPVGAPVLLLAGWAPEQFPYHRLLGPLGDARCQVTDVVPLDQSARHGLHVAVVARRVDALAPPRAYLMDLGRDDEAANGAADEGRPQDADGLGALLRLANEHALGGFVARPARRRLLELGDRIAELERTLAGRDAERTALQDELAARQASLAVAERELARTRKRIATLQSSATFRLGSTLVDGARHPGRAVVSVPVNLARIWRSRRARSAAPPVPAPGEAATDRPKSTTRTVSIGVPGLRFPRRELTMTAPPAFLIPRKLAKDGLAGYETSAVPCFLAALDTAGPGAVLDIGANVGLYAGLAAALTTRQVVAFEPSPALADVARRFAAGNDLGFRTESIAIGRETGTATLYLSDSSDSSNSLAAGFRESTTQIEVPVATLDAYVDRTGTIPAVIKIDTESTEPDVLFGAAATIRAHRPWILCEVLAGRVEQRLTEALAPHGYHWYHITDEVPYQRATVIEGDRTYQHLMWLFAPEPPDEAFWAAVRAWRADVADSTATPAEPPPPPAPRAALSTAGT